jgi:hypothetical protein
MDNTQQQQQQQQENKEENKTSLEPEGHSITTVESPISVGEQKKKKRKRLGKYVIEIFIYAFCHFYFKILNLSDRW